MKTFDFRRSASGWNPNEKKKKIRLCGPNGKCVERPDGAACICNEGFNGPFCGEIVKDSLFLSKRCAVYETIVTQMLGITVGCSDKNQICVAEKLSCSSSTCSVPMGWCLEIGPR